MKSTHPFIGALLVFPACLSAQLLVDFNTNGSSGGTPVAGDPADASNANHQEAGYECYHARHENAGDFIPATYNPTFGITGPATVTMTPTWPNTAANTVQQSIGRNQTQADSWIGNETNLLRDWIGCDARTAQSGNGTWDGTNGAPTYLELTFQGLPSSDYQMTTFHHDVENMNSNFTIEISEDGGTTFAAPIEGRITNSLAAGNPAENEFLAGTPPNVEGGDPKELTSTQVFTFSADAQDVVLRFTPYHPTNADNVHLMFFALNGFHLEQTLGLEDTDGDSLPDSWEDQHFGNSDGIATPTELSLQNGSGNPDGDGLDNEAEFQNETDPNDRDTDDDTLLDHEEVANSTNPNNEDTDGDTLLDGAEVNLHLTNPNERDSDGDFFYDQNEIETAPAGPGSANDATVYPISSTGLLVDFSSTTLNEQVGLFHDQNRQPYVADHETNFSVDRTEIYPVPAFGGVSVSLTVDFPDTVDPLVKQLIGRGSAAAYDGADAALAREWIGIDARAGSGGNGYDTPTSIRFTLEGVPAGSYLYSSFHHDVADQFGDFDVLLTDANNTNVLYDSRSMTASNSGTNPGAGQTLHSLPSTFNALVTSNGVDPIIFTYQGTEQNDGDFGTIVQQSFVGINGFDLISAADTDGDGLSDEYEIANGLDHTVADSGDDKDLDGLSNLQEFQIGTQPNAEDTDLDGANDGAEITAGSNPFVQDSDGDTLLDGEELVIGSDPTNIDTDGDGITDEQDPEPTNASSPAANARLVSYWPLDETPDGFTTPDFGPNGYDLTLTSMTSANFVLDEGRRAAQFDNASGTLLSRISSPEDQLPITKHVAYTISMWVKIEGAGQNDLRIFSEGSTFNDTPLFNIGTHNEGADGALDFYIRPDGGPAHQYTFGTPLDAAWRHIAVTGNDHTDTLQVYLDGELDEANITFRSLIDSEIDTTSIGAILRGNASHWVTGLVDEVALWSKILSPSEILELSTGVSPIALGNGLGLTITNFSYNPRTTDTSLTWNTLPGKTYGLYFTDDLADLKKGELDDSITDNGPTDTNSETGVITYEFQNEFGVDQLFFSVHEK